MKIKTFIKTEGERVYIGYRSSALRKHIKRFDSATPFRKIFRKK